MIGIIGDIHHKWLHLQRIWDHLDAKGITTAIAVGDFGFDPDVWPPHAHGECEIKVIDGNHEHFWWMQHQGWLNAEEEIEVAENISYIPRGTVQEIEGRNFLFIGGAESIGLRMFGTSWFEEEKISYADVEKCLTASNGITIDTVISHDCPWPFLVQSEHKAQLDANGSRNALEAIRQATCPKSWYCGHHHVSSKGEYEGCKWEVVAMNECIIVP